MQQKTDGADALGEKVRLPAGVVLQPPVSTEDLKADTEYDPEGAEEFVTLIRALRQERARPVTI